MLYALVWEMLGNNEKYFVLNCMGQSRGNYCGVQKVYILVWNWGKRVRISADESGVGRVETIFKL